MLICPRCTRNFISSPGNDWLSFKCRYCEIKLCFNCGRELHFPALCTEYLKWLRVGRPSQRILQRVTRDQRVRRRQLKFKYGRRVRNCQNFWQYSEEVSSAVETWQDGFLIQPNPMLSGIFFANPDLYKATIQLKSMLQLGKWIKLICSINPHMEHYLDPFKVRFDTTLSHLLEALPPVSMEAQTADITRFRRDAALAQSTLLSALLLARSTPGLQAMAFQPRNATLLQVNGILNEIINPDLPITLFQPLRGELDVTYLALLHQESSLLTSGQ